MRLLRWLGRALVKIAIDAMAWAVIQSAAGYGVHRLPVRRIDHDTWVTRPRRWERGGAFYVDHLGIRHWKGRLPEAGALFAGGFDKGRLAGGSPDQLRRHVVETRRAEVGHWLALLPAPLFWRWNPRWLAIVMSLYALVINAPCIAAQRYNRLRMERVLRRQEEAAETVSGPRRPGNGSRDVPAARSRNSRGTTGSNMP